jgi:hypothetical protein
MRWLTKIFSPPFRRPILFILIAAIVASSALLYRLLLDQRGPTPGITFIAPLINNTEASALKMERSDLTNELANLTNHYFILTNAALARAWSNSVNLAPLDPDVRQAWTAYLHVLSPIIHNEHPDLETFLTLRSAYDVDADRLAHDFEIKDKRRALLNLQSGKFATLFTNTAYVADARQFEIVADNLIAPTVRASRHGWRSAVADYVRQTEPPLGQYADSWLAERTRADEIRARLVQLTADLEERGEIPPSGASTPGTGRLFRKAERGLRHAVQVCFPRPLDLLLLEALTLAGGILLSQPVELRRRRIGKIAASLVFVYAGWLLLSLSAASGLTAEKQRALIDAGCLVPALGLAAVWLRHIDWLLPAGASGGRGGNLDPAVAAASKGRFKEAIRLIDPGAFAGKEYVVAVLLKAKLHHRLGHHWRTKRLLRSLLLNPLLTIEEVDYVRTLLKAVGDAQNPVWGLFAPEDEA